MISRIHRNSASITTFNSLLKDDKCEIYNLCEEVFEVVARAENRADILKQLPRDHNDSPEGVLFSRIKKSWKQWNTVNNRPENVNGGREEMLQEFLIQLCGPNKSSSQEDILKVLTVIYEKGDTPMELNSAEIKILGNIFEHNLKKLLKETGMKKAVLIKRICMHLKRSYECREPHPCAIILHHIYSS